MKHWSKIDYIMSSAVNDATQAHLILSQRKKKKKSSLNVKYLPDSFETRLSFPLWLHLFFRKNKLNEYSLTFSRMDARVLLFPFWNKREKRKLYSFDAVSICNWIHLFWQLLLILFPKRICTELHFCTYIALLLI